MEEAMCRICLAQNIRLNPISEELQNVYEKLCEHSFEREFSSLLVCYICHARLRNSHKLMIRCRLSEQILTVKAKDIQKDSVNMESSRFNTLSITLVEQTSVCEEVTVKQEPPELLEVEVDLGAVHTSDSSDRSLNSTDAQTDRQSSVNTQFPDDYIALMKAYTQLKMAVAMGGRIHCVTDDTGPVIKPPDKKTSIKVTPNTRPYKCTACPNSFFSPSALKNHSRIHTGEKPYTCHVCKRKFRHKTHLNDHMRTHTGEKPYQCGLCTKTFRHQTHLNNHMRTHTGEKPYKCPMCESSFSQKGTLDSHILKHTGEKPISCNLCETRFTNRSSLSRHMRRKHKKCADTTDNEYTLETEVNSLNQDNLITDEIDTVDNTIHVKIEPMDS